MQYIVQVKDLDGNISYYCAKNKHEATLYRDSTPRYVHIFSAQDFLNSLPKLPICWDDYKHKLDDYLL